MSDCYCGAHEDECFTRLESRNAKLEAALRKMAGFHVGHKMSENCMEFCPHEIAKAALDEKGRE
jgi:hypothetical protein